MLKRIVHSILFLLVWSQAYAADSWSPPEIVGNNVKLWLCAEVALDANGNATAVFSCYNSKKEGLDIWIEAATKPANGTWSSPVALSQKVTTEHGAAVYPRVWIDA